MEYVTRSPIFDIVMTASEHVPIQHLGMTLAVLSMSLLCVSSFHTIVTVSRYVTAATNLELSLSVMSV